MKSHIEKLKLTAVVRYDRFEYDYRNHSPKVPSRFNAGYGIIAFLVILGIVFPLFGLSLLVILAANFLAGKLPAASRERAAQ